MMRTLLLVASLFTTPVFAVCVSPGPCDPVPAPCFGPGPCEPVDPEPLFEHIKRGECPLTKHYPQVFVEIYNPDGIPLAGAKGLSQRAQCEAIQRAVRDGF